MRFKGSRKIVGGLALAAGIALTGVVAVAQQQQEPAQGQGRGERQWGPEGGKGRRGGRGGGRFERLNLSDAQREQMRQIEERYRATFRAQHEGMRGGDARQREHGGQAQAADELPRTLDSHHYFFLRAV